MARDVRRGAGSRTTTSGPGSVISFITGLMVGLTVAVVVYFVMVGRVPEATKSAKLATPEVLAPVAKEEPQVMPPPSEPVSASPKPTFDFYKILPGSEAKVPEAELSGNTKTAPGTTPDTANSSYLLQVGSYQKFEEADQAKAQLALQGISSTIQQLTNKGHEIWYRVHVGPIKSMDEVQSMRARLIEGGAKGVVLKVGAPQ